MPTITVDTDTAKTLRLLGSAWMTDENGAINRLIAQMTASDPQPSASGSANAEGILVHALYEGSRIEGIYNPLTRALTVTSGPVEGQAFKSPSGAAIAVVQALNPTVNPNRNGWTFWTVSGTGSTLQSVRHG